MEERLSAAPDHVPEAVGMRVQLSIMARRARWINAAITLITLSALFIALVVVMLFVNAFLRWELAHSSPACSSCRCSPWPRRCSRS